MGTRLKPPVSCLVFVIMWRWNPSRINARGLLVLNGLWETPSASFVTKNVPSYIRCEIPDRMLS